MSSQISLGHSSVERDNSPVVGRSESRLKAMHYRKVNKFRNVESLPGSSMGGIGMVDLSQLKAYALNRHQIENFTSEF